MKKVKIVFYDEAGSDSYLLEGREIDLDNNVSGTVAEVGAALKEKGYSVETVHLRNPRGLDSFIRNLQADDSIVFNLCEGAFGKSAFEMNVAALLELGGVRFTGNGPMTLGLSLDKALTKDILSSRGIGTASYCVMDRAEAATLKPGLAFPLIVKPLKEDASVGITRGAVVNDPDGLEKRVEFVVANYHQPAMVEQYIEGREFNVAVLGYGAGARALPVSEIEFVDFPEDAPKICCYEAKWVPESPFYKKTVPVCPARVDDGLGRRLKDVALRTYNIMGCRDYARVDMRVGTDGEVRVLEVNPNPDISPDAGFARAARAAGLDYPSLVAHIVELAEKRYGAKARKAACLS